MKNYFPEFKTEYHENGLGVTYTANVRTISDGIWYVIPFRLDSTTLEGHTILNMQWDLERFVRECYFGTVNPKFYLKESMIDELQISEEERLADNFERYK